jgi:putative salt-induced outer membrane protein YdiY
MVLRRLVFLVAALASSRALADDPKWTYGKMEEVKKVEWKASVNAGMLLNTGNANTLAFSAGASASRNDGKNKVQLDVGGTYARATVITAHDDNGDNLIQQDEIHRDTSTTAQLWNIKLRYDRFLSLNNSLYGAGFATGNVPAGIQVAGGAQLGYSRQIVKNDMHLWTAEIGYDYTFQDNVTGPNLSIHSARAFSGYTVTLSKDVGLAFGLEVLCNLNELPGFQPMQTVGSFHDTRVNGNAALTARLWKNIAFQVSFLAKYTTDPAPLPLFGGVKFDPSMGVPLAQPLDTVTSLSLVVTLL